MKRYTFIILAICLCVAGCRSHKDARRNTASPSVGDTTAVATTKPEKPHAERLDTIVNAEYSTLSANFRCTVQGLSVSGQLRMSRDSIVWVSVSKLLELGRAQLTPARVQAYAKLMDKKYDLAYGDLKKNWDIDADFATLQALLVANCPPHCRKSKEPQRQGDTVTLWFDQGSDGRQLTLRKDYRTRRIVGADLQSRTAGQRIVLTYSDWATVNGQLLPTTVDIKIASRKMNEQTTVRLERITLNQPQSFPFKM